MRWWHKDSQSFFNEFKDGADIALLLLSIKYQEHSWGERVDKSMNNQMQLFEVITLEFHHL